MNEQELREMIRASIARHLGASEGPSRAADTTAGAGPAWLRGHPSHLRLPLVSGDEEGACIIEPSVRCNHCGYCLSMGH
jgi:hypothetical protein